MQKKQLFCGVGTAIATPFQDGEIDFEAFGRLIDLQTEYADALIVAGTTGEAPTLSEKERDALLSFALTRVEGRIPVIMGTGSNDTSHAVALTKRAAALGADGVLTVTPYYNRGTHEGVRRHFLSVAECSDAPVILYNVPARTGSSLSYEDYAAILPHPNVAGVKEAEENTERVFRLCNDFEDTAIYTGSDAFLLPAMALGCAGVISVVSNLYPATVHGIIRDAMCGDLSRARRAFVDLFPICRLLFAETSPSPLKEALRLLGYGSGECRLPLTPPSNCLKAALAGEISRLSTLGIS